MTISLELYPQFWWGFQRDIALKLRLYAKMKTEFLFFSSSDSFCLIALQLMKRCFQPFTCTFQKAIINVNANYLTQHSNCKQTIITVIFSESNLDMAIISAMTWHVNRPQVLHCFNAFTNIDWLHWISVLKCNLNCIICYTQFVIKKVDSVQESTLIFINYPG